MLYTPAGSARTTRGCRCRRAGSGGRGGGGRAGGSGSPVSVWVWLLVCVCVWVGDLWMVGVGRHHAGMYNIDYPQH